MQICGFHQNTILEDALWKVIDLFIRRHSAWGRQHRLHVLPFRAFQLFMFTFFPPVPVRFQSTDMTGMWNVKDCSGAPISKALFPFSFILCSAVKMWKCFLEKLSRRKIRKTNWNVAKAQWNDWFCGDKKEFLKLFKLESFEITRNYPKSWCNFCHTKVVIQTLRCRKFKVCKEPSDKLWRAQWLITLMWFSEKGKIDSNQLKSYEHKRRKKAEKKTFGGAKQERSRARDFFTYWFFIVSK